MLNRLTRDAEHIYLALGLCLSFYYPHFFRKRLNTMTSLPKK